MAIVNSDDNHSQNLVPAPYNKFKKKQKHLRERKKKKGDRSVEMAELTTIFTIRSHDFERIA